MSPYRGLGNLWRLSRLFPSSASRRVSPKFLQVPVSPMALAREQVSALDFKRDCGLMKRGRDFLQRTFSFSVAHAENDLYFSLRELDEKVVKLHIPHSVKSSPPIPRRAVSRGVKVQSLFGREVPPVRRSPGTKIRGESSSNGSEIAECRGPA